MFTEPLMFDVGNNVANKKIANALGDSYAKNCKDLCINASNSSVAWLHYWKDTEDNFKYGVIGERYDVYECWTDTECQAVRKKAVHTVDGGIQAYMMFITLYADTGTSEEALKLIQ